MRFQATRVLVTGGSRGIGAAIVRAFCAEGARVAVGARSMASIERFIAAHGNEGLIPAPGDVGDRDACRQMVHDAIAALGGLDVLVNAAGVYWEAAPEAIDAEHWDRTIAINLGGPFHCIQAALPALRESRGNVVSIASDAGLAGMAGAAAYCAAKGGLVNLTRALALDLVPDVRVNCVCPGNVDTEMLAEAGAASGDPVAYRAWAERYAPMGRMARPQEIAAAVLYLAGPDAGFVTGAALAIDGGRTAGPSRS